MTMRPNILFLMSDEHRPDVVGYEGNTIVRTPVLDELARTGVVFRNAYTPSPICVPARQCMMAGQLPRTAGCEGWIDLPPGHLTFSRLFSQYAYRTVCCGKLHHNGFDQMQGWTDRPAGDIHVSPPHIQGKIDDEFTKYERPFKDFKWSDTKEVKRAGVGASHLTNWDQEWTDSAVRFIEEYFNNAAYDREQTQPIMLKVSLVQPHYPYQTDAARFGYYLNRVEPFLDEPPFSHPFLSQRQVVPGQDALPREIRRATAAYYGMIETIDSHYGRIQEALRYVGQDLDDWIIIYTTDHGEMLGEHGIWEKQKFFEASARVPLTIRWPKRFREARVVTENVNLCDLYATLCELCEIPCPDGLDSRSLVPLMEGNASEWNDETVSQFGQHNVMIKQGHLKYQYYGPDMPEVLFDLEKDPGERQDFANDPDYVSDLSRFRSRLAELGHGPNGDPDYRSAGYQSMSNK